MEYAIHESNIERLEKKLTRIANKCKAYGIEFKYEQKGEMFKEFKNLETKEVEVRRYIIVEAEGKAEQSGWEFVASLTHTEEGNLIRGYGEYEVPSRYYSCKPVCEHCNSNRARKETYIVYNKEKDEFKQVGKNCLADFTHGLDAEGVAQYISCFDELIKGEAPSEGHYNKSWFDLIEMLCYFNETIKHFGYEKSDPYRIVRSTSSRTTDYFMIDHHKTAYWSTEEVNRCKKEMAEVGFKAMTEENESKAKEMVEWVLAQKNDNNYFHNLKVICSQKYIESSNFGIVASIPATYDKTLEIEAEKRRREEELKNSKPSEYVGAIGDRITIDVKSVRVLWTRDTQWGLTFGIEIKDTNDNIYIWSTSSCIDENTKQIKATVKDHSEFRDKKQTVITRGKVVA